MDDTYRPWRCTRQRAGPLLKECRALRPRLSPNDSAEDRAAKRALRPYANTPTCHSSIDKLELRLALFGYEGTHYTLTFDSAHLPRNKAELQKEAELFRERLKRWKRGKPFDWLCAIEGLHGDHRYHLHMVFRDSEFSPPEIRHKWRRGEVDEEPVLLPVGGYRRLAKYFHKERRDGKFLPIGTRYWTGATVLSRKLELAEDWDDVSGRIDIPDGVMWSRRNSIDNDFGAYHYASWILAKPERFPGK